jgi:glutamate N-acetyltransferase/amino-acid N-acetyltransferase
MTAIEHAIPSLAARLRPDGFQDLAAAMLTTDTVPKIVRRQIEMAGGTCTVLGVAKGSGMIRPDLATMLCFVCTDAAVPSQALQAMLHRSVERSFNRITIDGDTSTNDTVLLLANGRSGARTNGKAEEARFQEVLDDVLRDLSRALVADGEGATKLVTVTVRGARTREEARAVADTIAHSPLVKTAIFGEDANWGRLMMAVGRAGVPLEPGRIDLFFDNVQLVSGGAGSGKAAEDAAAEVMRRPAYTISVDLNQGGAATSLLTCDLSLDYVRINADYRS